MNSAGGFFRRRGVLLSAGGAGLLLVAYALFSRQSDEERIAESMVRLARVLSFESPPNVLTRAASLNGAFKELLVEDARVRIVERGFSAQGRKELSTLASRATAGMQRFVVHLEPSEISVSGDRAEARAALSVDAQSGSSDRGDDREATFNFIKLDGDWLLASCVVHEPTYE